jgi:CheY-like chemotaxis protein
MADTTELFTTMLVDDNPEFARSVVAFLKEEPGIWLRAVAEDVHEALNLIVTHPPDLVLLGIKLPDVDGLRAV